MAGPGGVEPPIAVLETAVMPFNYGPTKETTSLLLCEALLCDNVCKTFLVLTYLQYSAYSFGLCNFGFCTQNTANQSKSVVLFLPFFVISFPQDKFLK